MPTEQDLTKEWKRVVFSSECTFEDWDIYKEMPICPECKIEYANCDCPGCHQDDIYEYKEVKGNLYARPLQSDKGN